MKKIKEKGKPVLLIEYAQKPEMRAMVTKRAHENGMILLITDRPLKTLGQTADEAN